MTDWPVRESALESDDTSLVEAARLGDRSAYGRLYDRYARMIHGVLLARVPPGGSGRSRTGCFSAGDAAARLVARARAIRRVARRHCAQSCQRFLPPLAAHDGADRHAVAANQIADRSATSAEMAQASAILAAIRANFRMPTRDFDSAPRRRHDRPRDCRAHRTDSRLGARKSPSRNATAPRETRSEFGEGRNAVTRCEESCGNRYGCSAGAGTRRTSYE